MGGRGAPKTDPGQAPRSVRVERISIILWTRSDPPGTRCVWQRVAGASTTVRSEDKTLNFMVGAGSRNGAAARWRRARVWCREAGVRALACAASGSMTRQSWVPTPFAARLGPCSARSCRRGREQPASGEMGTCRHGLWFSVVREESHEAQAWIDRCCGCCAARGGVDGVPGLAGRRSGREDGGRPGRGIFGRLQFLLPSGPGRQDRP